MKSIARDGSEQAPRLYGLINMNNKPIARGMQRDNLSGSNTILTTAQRACEPSSCKPRAQSWRQLVRASAERFSPEADPTSVRTDVLSTIALPYNADIACDVILAGLTMIIEHHRNHRRPADTDKLMEDLAGYVTSIAKQNELMQVS